MHLKGCVQLLGCTSVWVGIAFLKSLSSTFVLQELQKRSAEKGLEILLRQGYGGQKGGAAVFAVLAARYN